MHMPALVERKVDIDGDLNYAHGAMTKISNKR
jgi:hypothetical protein